MLFSLIVPIVCSPVCLGVVRLSVPGNKEQNTQIQNFTLTAKRIYVNVILSYYVVMAKYISIYFDIFYEKLVYSGWPPARSKKYLH